MASTILIQALIVLIGYTFYWQLFRKPKKNLPPGPKGLPLIGNIFDLPGDGTPDFVHWRSITDKYGPLASITFMGQPMIIIANKEDAQEILEKKCSTSSTRPNFVFGHYAGFGGIVSAQQHGKEFKLHRKFMHRGLGTKLLVSKYADIQELHAGLLVQETRKAPENIIQHLENHANAVMLKLLYGYNINPHGDDPLVKLNDRVNINFFRALDAFGRLVEFLPMMKQLPDWFPGTKFKAEAKKHNPYVKAYGEVPYKFTRRQMMNDKAMDSYVAKLVQEYIGDTEEPNEADEHAIMWSAGGLQVGGAETTVTTITGFILGAIMFPDVLRKAQEEVDRVTGGTRMPVLADREQMPFIDATVSEALRWFTLTPMGVPHAVSVDTTYKGYFLPKGAILSWTSWDFCHDPSVYRDPYKFDPERFLAPRNEPNAKWTAFGFGRRICPGRHLAEASLFLNMASLVAFFDFSKKVDEQGNVLEPKLAIDPIRSAAARPAAFPFKVTPRSERHVELLKALEKNYVVEESDAGLLGEMPPL
ncbi:cytochrome P450 [Trichoderma evansii]